MVVCRRNQEGRSADPGLEAKLFLQDTLWQETRREQRRIQRWLVWSRLRRRRLKKVSGIFFLTKKGT